MKIKHKELGAYVNFKANSDTNRIDNFKLQPQSQLQFPS